MACSRGSGGGYRRSRPDRLQGLKEVCRKNGIWRKTVEARGWCGATRRAAHRWGLEGVAVGTGRQQGRWRGTQGREVTDMLEAT